MFFDPLSAVRLSLEASKIALDAQFVVAMRLAGMCGLWETDHKEIRRMIAEKPAAAQKSVAAAVAAVQRGETPDRVVLASMAPIGKAASGNVDRLSRKGPKFP